MDSSPRALELARQRRAAGKETYLLADLFALPAELRSRFDWVFEHTCFCAIEPARRADYVRAVAGALRPGGQLLAIFYLDPWIGEAEPPAPENGPPFGTTRQELDALFGETFVLVQETLPTHAFPGHERGEIVRLLRGKTRTVHCWPDLI